MTNKIGFYCDDKEINENTENTTVEKPEVKARKSLVSIRFEKNNRVLSYYNDKFDLHKGDIVFVDGKFEIAKKNIRLKYCGSENQKVIDVKKTLENQEIVLFA